MKKGLLVIGDKGKKHGHSLDPSFNQFTWYLNKFKKNTREEYIISYEEALAGDFPEFKTASITVVLFFPFRYWDKHIEVYKKDSRIYGDKKFGADYKKFFERFEKIIKKTYRHKKIEFVNPPKSAILDRDKIATKETFKRHRIPTPKSFNIKKLADLNRVLKNGRVLYVKPRFGSMGKGITYIDKDSVRTNFLFRGGKIISRSYDYHWKFCDIKEKDRNKFLKTLIQKDFVWEEAVDSATYRGRRFDFRMYYLFGKVPYYYARTTDESAVVTNWSQGGKLVKGKVLNRYIPESKVKKAKALVKKVAKELKLNYAGVDVIFSKDYKQAYVLEAHSFPGYEKGYRLMKEFAKKV